MKFTKSDLHEDLRPSVGLTKPLTYLLSRKWGFRLLQSVFGLQKGQKVKGLSNDEIYIKSNNDGPDIRVRIYKPLNHTGQLPVMLYLHGGGYAMGCPEQVGDLLKKFIEKRPCVIVAPAYRRSLQEAYPAAFNDCYDTLLWINENAEQLNVIKDQIIVAGHSAGGGLTAAVTLKARDTQDVKIAFQMPIYPMIDDLQANESSPFLSPIWDARSNAIGWDLYLKDLKLQGAEIPAYAAPSRNKDYQNFPPTITFVGDAEPFRDETIEYVEGLKKFNIPVKFKRYEKCYHGFDLLASKTNIAQDALNFTFDSYAEFYDTYLLKEKV